MSIVYYPNRVYKGKVPAIDREMAKRNPQIVQGSQSINATALDVTISANTNWQLNSIGWVFSAATARNFSAVVKQGRKVVENLNDYLWFETPTVGRQKITLDADFYTGTELGVELQAQMNANSTWAAAGITFTVSYNSSTGLFTITPSSGTIRYLNTNTAQTLSSYDSIAGHLFGLTVNGTLGATVVSDTTVFGLDSEVPFVSETASVALAYSHNEVHTLGIDQAVCLTTNSGVAITVDYVVNYEEIV